MAKSQSENYIRLFRKMTNWEWYKDSKTKALFLHCLLRANWAPGDWYGIHCEAGQFVTSIAKLAEETGLSVREVRTALAHLSQTRDITQEATKGDGPKCSLITVNNWAKYQKETWKRTRRKATEEEYKRKGGPSQGSAAPEKEAVESGEWEWEDASVLRERMRRENENEGAV